MKDVPEIKRVVKAYLGDSRRLGALTGRANVTCRAHIMSVINGKKTPKSKSGINAITDALLEVSGVTGTCIADREDKLIKWLFEEEEK